MAQRSLGRTYKRCSCSDSDGKQIGKSCPELGKSDHGSWYYAVTITSLNGKADRPRLGGFGSEAAARKEMLELIENQDRDVIGKIWTVGRWLDHWMDGNRSRLAESTIDGYDGHIRRDLRPGLGKIRLAELRTVDIQDMFRAVGARTTKDGTVLTGSTLQAIRSTLNSALNEAKRRGLIQTNPCKGVRLPAKMQPPVQLWTPTREAIYRQTGQRPAIAVWRKEHLVRFITATQHDPLFAMWLIVAMRGPRRGELAGARLVDHDPETAELRMDHQGDFRKGRYTCARTKTPQSERVVALDEYTNRILATHVQRQLARARADGDTSGAMFTRRGKPISRSWITANFPKLVARLGLPPVRLHDLRHGAATIQLAAGVHVKVIQETLGHKHFRTTLETYTHVLGELAHESSQQVADWLLGPALREIPPDVEDDDDEPTDGVLAAA